MRQCWIDHDDCENKCPCNKECPDGCPEPYDGQSCNVWFCQGYIEQCAAEDDRDREPCNHGDPDGCKQAGCCWVEFHGDHNVPWCHQKKRYDLYP